MGQLKNHMDRHSLWIDQELKRLLRRSHPAPIRFLAQPPKAILKSMEYSLLAGGKRLRPILVMAAAQCCGLNPRKALKTACAMEMIHTYSLIHDDLPAMDNDDLRRGKATNHKVFGEALAILAGDGLLTYAFELAAENARDLGLGYGTSELIRVIAAGAGSRGMVGGQVVDLEAEGWSDQDLRNGSRSQARKLIQYIHTHKTAALIAASLEAGAVLAQASNAQRRALREYGQAIGLAFQITDDILDRIGDKKKLGKLGSDLGNQKLTYPRLYGITRSRQLALEFVQRAHSFLHLFGARAALLHDLADFIAAREK